MFPTVRARVTYCAHLFKALTRQHHRALLPLLAPHIPQDGIVLDVGAHAGQLTKLFSGMTPAGHVYAFEPGGYARSILKTVRRVRRLKNVTVLPCGLSDENTQAVLNIPVKNSGSLGFGLGSLGAPAGERRIHAETVALRRLDDVVAEYALPRVDFIKADIEGWELHMLRGAQQTLCRYKPVLLLELNDSALRRAGSDRAGVVSFLQALGYVPVAHGDDAFFIPAPPAAAGA